MDLMNIGQLAAKAGVATSAIRYYESEGLLEAPARQSGWRRYDARAYDRLLVIQAARELGFGVAEIRTLLHPQRKGAKPAARWRAFARKKLAEVDATLQRAATMKRLIEAGLNCDCGEIGTCICSKGESCYPQQVLVKVSEVG